MVTTSDQPALESADAGKQDATPVQVPTDGEEATSSGLPVDNSNIDGEKQDVTPDGTSADIEKGPVLDPNIVDWDGPDDPANPINFSGSLKSINVGIVSALTFITPLASSMFAPGVPELMAEFKSTNTLLAGFVVSVYVLGFAIGPLVLAPASELYGRAIIYHICNVGFIIFSVACAVSTDLGMLIAFRFFQGCFGSAPVTNGTLYLHPSLMCPIDVDLLICSPHRRRHNRRPYRTRETRRCNCHLCPRTLTRASHWTCSRRIPRSRSRLAMGLLGPYNDRRILHCHLSSLPARDLYNGAPQAQNCPTYQGNRKHQSALKTRQRSDCETTLRSIYYPTSQDPYHVAYRLRQLTIHWCRLWISIPHVCDLHRRIRRAIQISNQVCGPHISRCWRRIIVRPIHHWRRFRSHPQSQIRTNPRVTFRNHAT